MAGQDARPSSHCILLREIGSVQPGGAGGQAGTSAIQGTSWAVTSESGGYWGCSAAALGGLAASCGSLVLGSCRGASLTASCSLSPAPREPVNRPRPGSCRSGSRFPLPGSKWTTCGGSWPAGSCQRCPGHRPTAAASPVGPCPLLWVEAQQLRQARWGAASLGHLHLLLGDVHAWGAHLPGSWVPKHFKQMS